MTTKSAKGLATAATCAALSLILNVTGANSATATGGTLYRASLVAYPAKRSGGTARAARRSSRRQRRQKLQQRAIKLSTELASLFGPGLFGGRTACGQILTKQLLGVAHRTLPCGTKIRIAYASNSLVVRVVDHGPWNDRQWDLTWATAQALGFSGVGKIGVSRV